MGKRRKGLCSTRGTSKAQSNEMPPPANLLSSRRKQTLIAMQSQASGGNGPV